MASTLTPVVFIHGLWLHSSSWDPWVKLFRRLGYEPIAPGWPYEPDDIHEARLQMEAVASVGLDDVTEHYGRIIRQLDSMPILIGHSTGGLVAQKLLGNDLGRAAVAIDSAQFKGVWTLPPNQIRAAWPALKNPVKINRAVPLTADEFRYGFGNALSLEESTELFTQYSIPSPARPVFAISFANFNTHSTAAVNIGNNERGPLLLIAGGRDNTVPASVVRAQHKLYEKSSAVTDIQEFPDRGHSITIDSGWREVADATLDWIKRVSARRRK
ncbi:MAG TPA: alpha/beta hydrolase [Candidatus Pristimantibacillus sp.]|nr:alpha/beta hydrolase [Candidatus Pristimantibacillus sp.]